MSVLAILILATIFGENPYRSFWSNFERMEGLVTFLHLGAYFLVASSVINTKTLWRRFFQTSLLASVGIVFYALVQVFGKLAIHQGSVRVDATLGNATYLAVYTLFQIFFAVYLVATSSSRFEKWFYSLIGLANLFVMYKTATRGTILGLLAGVLIFGALSAWRGRGQVRKIALSALGVVALIIVLFFGFRHSDLVTNSPVLSRFASISMTETTTNSRFLIWQMSLQGFKEHPILGWGPENYISVFDKYYNSAMWPQEPWFDRSHNVFFDWLINAGLLGLVAYLALFILTLWYIWRSKEDLVIKSLVTGLLAGYFIHNIFVFDNLISYIFFFSLLAWVNVVYADGGTIEVPSKHKAEPIENDSLRYLFAGMVIVVMCGVMYFVSIKPIQAAQGLIRGIIPNQDPAVTLESFKSVLALNTFGSGETREQLLNAAVDVAGRDDVSPELRQAWFDLATSQMAEAIKSGRQDGARANLIFSTFLARFGSADKNYYTHALEYADRARLFSPKKQSVLMQQSMLHLARGEAGDQAQALELARQAFTLDEAYPEARKNYIFVAMYAGKNDLAKALLAGTDDNDVLTDPRFKSLIDKK